MVSKRPDSEELAFRALLALLDPSFAELPDDLSGPTEDGAIVWRELAGAFRELNGFGSLGRSKWNSLSNGLNLDSLGEVGQRCRVFRIEFSSSSKPVLRFRCRPL